MFPIDKAFYIDHNRKVIYPLPQEDPAKRYTYMEFYNWVRSEFDKPQNFECLDPMTANIDQNGNVVFREINGWKLSEECRRILVSHRPIAYILEIKDEDSQGICIKQ